MNAISAAIILAALIAYDGAMTWKHGAPRYPDHQVTNWAIIIVGLIWVGILVSGR